MQSGISSSVTVTRSFLLPQKEVKSGNTLQQHSNNHQGINLYFASTCAYAWFVHTPPTNSVSTAQKDRSGFD